MEKRRNTSTEFSLPPICSDKYPYKHLAVKTNFSVLHIKVLSFKGISCSMYLIVY